MSNPCYNVPETEDSANLFIGASSKASTVHNAQYALIEHHLNEGTNVNQIDLY